MADNAGMAASPDLVSDEDVVARVLGGNSAMFEIIMRSHNQRLYRVARAILRSDAEAEDVMRKLMFGRTNIWDSLPGGQNFPPG